MTGALWAHHLIAYNPIHLLASVNLLPRTDIRPRLSGRLSTSMRRASWSSDEVDRRTTIEKENEGSASIRQGDAADTDLERRLEGTKEGREEDDSQLGQQRAEVEAAEEGNDALEHAATTTEKPTSGLTGVLSRVISRASTVDPGPPPDGGAKAWMIGKISFTPGAACLLTTGRAKLT